MVYRLEIETEKLLPFPKQPVTVLCPLAGSCEYFDEPQFIIIIIIIIIIIKEHAANYNHCHGDFSQNSQMCLRPKHVVFYPVAISIALQYMKTLVSKRLLKTNGTQAEDWHRHFCT